MNDQQTLVNEDDMNRAYFDLIGALWEIINAAKDGKDVFPAIDSAIGLAGVMYDTSGAAYDSALVGRLEARANYQAEQEATP